MIPRSAAAPPVAGSGDRLGGAHRSAVPKSPVIAPATPDVFARTFARRVGPEMASSFTPEQMAAIRRAFGARQIGSHAIDLRRTVGILGLDFYVVLLCGRESRSADRRRLERSVARQIVSTLAYGALSLVAVTAGLAFLMSWHS